jgi:hypothetical protein
MVDSALPEWGGEMLLALVFTVHAATASPNPCTDQMSMLCRISPLFCPAAYPADLTPGSANVPCWPEKGTARDTRVVHRPTGSTGSTGSTQTQSVSPKRSTGDDEAPFGLRGRAATRQLAPR